MDIVNVAHSRRAGIRYVGRGGGKHPPSPLGNPFSHEKDDNKTRAPYRVESRERAIRAFRLYLWGALSSHEAIRLPFTVFDRARKEVTLTVEVTLTRREVEDFFRTLTPDSILGCHCAPASCHASVIASAFDWWMSLQQAQTTQQLATETPQESPTPA